jgi:hypothetical protein
MVNQRAAYRRNFFDDRLKFRYQLFFGDIVNPVPEPPVYCYRNLRVFAMKASAAILARLKC